MKQKEQGTSEPNQSTTNISTSTDDSLPNDEQVVEVEVLENEPKTYSEEYVADLQLRLKQAEDKAEMLQNRFKQAQVEINKEADELRSRLRRNAEERLEAAKGDIYKRMLELADNLERAVKSAEANADLNALLEGVKATYQLLLKDLENSGVNPITAVGEAFDPQIHEAVDILIVEEEKDGQVTAVYKAGYKFGGKLLRPAMVQVGRSN
ncbi:MAG: nucleotide exchange factor GrpE [Acidobacteria bacterium]|nr:nucleotide exchange factor GrpE [Acidobacteriota bacterium]